MSSAQKFRTYFGYGRQFLTNSLLSYSTIREAKIHSKRVSLVFRLFQIGIISYIIGWSIIYEKGYQLFDQPRSTVTTKVKGLGYTFTDKGERELRLMNQKFRFKTPFKDDFRIFDTADYIIPPVDYNSIFLMTNFVETRQTQGQCDENYEDVDCECQNDTDCSKIVLTNSWNGIPTGNCITSSTNESIKVCEIESWCPVEREIKNNEKNLIQNIENFTIFIKNDVTFERFDRKIRNILPNTTNQVISKCIYHPINDPYCPIFLVKDVLNEAEPNEQERKLMMMKGGVILVSINWKCNFDKSRLCFPTFKFSRFDLQFNKASAASGFNFRFAKYLEVNDTMYRMLIKAYGLRFVIDVSGEGGKFNFVPFLINLGAGLGLLSVASIVADFVLLNFTSRKKFYRELKELNSNLDEDSLTSNIRSKSFTDLKTEN